MKPLEVVGIVVGLAGLGVGVYMLLRQQDADRVQMAGKQAGLIAPGKVPDDVPGIAVKPAQPGQQLGDLVKGAGDAVGQVMGLVNQGRNLLDQLGVSGWFA